ncbi:MAG: RibD family protein [Pseudomonadota bacterium]
MDDAFWSDTLAYGRGEVASAPADPTGAAVFGPMVEAARRDRPLIVAQLGQSLDGRIATPEGESRYINGEQALRHLHRLRALVDAVVIGAGTARADDPRLTVRDCAGPNPARVVIDPNGTIPPDAQVWAEDGARRLVVGGHPGLPAGVTRLALRGAPIPPQQILAALHARGLSRVLIEGGGRTVSQFLGAGAIDVLHLLIGPVILGEGLPGLAWPRADRLDHAPRPRTRTHVFAGGDILVACDFRAQGAGG